MDQAVDLWPHSGAAAERPAKPARRGSSFPRDARDDEVLFEGPQRNPAER